MIITLKGANFSASNIGASSTWSISRVLGSGATYNGVTFVNKGAALNATVTIGTGYELGAAGVTVTMGGVTQSGVATVSGNTVTIKIGKVTGNVVINVPTKNISTGGEDVGGSSEYNSADMWLSQTISAVGALSTTGITQSNIMAKSKFIGTATFTSTGDTMQMALVTYNDDGSFKARGSWDRLEKGKSVTYTDANPFNVVIATSATNTSYTVAQMVSMLNVVGTSYESTWSGTVYSDDSSYWVRQSVDSGGNIINDSNETYNRSNIMSATKFNEPIMVTSKSVSLMTAIITYDASGKFVSRSSWTTLTPSQSVTYTDANPFNVVIATSAESTYSFEQMLDMVDVRSAN